MFWIFAVTLGALILALALYMRNVVGIVTPIVTSLVAAVWGFGFVGWLKSPIEPLLMIVPLLLVARSSRSDEHTFEIQSLMRISYAVFCLNNKMKPRYTKNFLYITKTRYEISH